MNEKPPRLTPIALGTSLIGTFQTPKATEFFLDDIVNVWKKSNAAGYVRPSVGDAHPDTASYSGYTLSVILPDPETQQDRLVYTKSRGSLISRRTNDVLQTVTDTATLVADNAALPTVSALVSFHDENLANSKARRTTTTLPSVFPAVEYSKTRPDVTPQKFRALIPIIGTSTTAAGTASAPTLVAGDVSASDSQQTLFTHRTSTANRAAVSLPISITSKKTNAAKQVVAVVETLEADSATPTVPTALIDVTFEKLGDGTALETTETIPAVFDKDTRSIEIPDITPAWAKALLPTTSTSSEAAATSVADPTLSTGQIKKRIQRTTAFTVQTDVTARDAASLPKTRTNKKLTTEFGGGLVDTVQTVATGTQTPSSGGLLVLGSEVEVLGDGTSVLSTDTVEGSAWPVVTSKPWDEEFRINYTRTEQVVAAGTVVGTVSDGTTNEIKGLDLWRSVRIITTKTPTATDSASAIVSYRKAPYTFPGRVDLRLFLGLGGIFSHKKPHADLVQITIKTWWEVSSTPPVINVPDIITNSFRLDDTFHGGSYTFENVLHDAFQYGSGLPVAATSPSFAVFAGITYESGSFTFTNGAAVPAHGSAVAGDSIWGFLVGSTWPLATQTIGVIQIQKPSSGWIGNLKVIGADVRPAKERNQWRVETQSVVMR